MKLKHLSVVPVLALSLMATSAQAVVIDFIKLTENSAANGGLGESYWSTLTIPGSFLPNTYGLQITGHASVDAPAVAGGPADTTQFAYLDWGTAGLGVCKDSKNPPAGAHPGSNTNRCNPGSDDNVTDHEYLEFVFDQDVRVDNLWFNNNHDFGFDSGDKVTIGVGPQAMMIDDAGGSFPGTAFDVALGYANGPNGIGAFNVKQGEKLWVAFNNEQFYVSAMEVSPVPLPSALWLFGTALVGFVGIGRRINVS